MDNKTSGRSKRLKDKGSKALTFILNKLNMAGRNYNDFLSSLQSYLNERYFEQIFPILVSEDDAIYTEIVVE